ncbi:TonB-dependent receptor [soil metagenome]
MNMRYYVLKGIRTVLLLCFMLIAATMVQAQNGFVTVKGTVRSDSSALEGVSIVLKSDPMNATRTDASGKFTISVPANGKLTFSFVGFSNETQDVKAGGIMNIVLQRNNDAMQEVAVVAYGYQKKISLVGAQSTVNMEELKQPVANLSAALAGRIAGLVGVQRTGLPGSNGADLWIRGISTFNNSNDASALIIVDGVQGRDINAFDPEDIASFTILKDASATAVYGVAGANGVILIQTKKGKTGKPVLMFNFNEGINSFTKTPELADAYTYMNLKNEAQIASGLLPDYSQAYIDSTIAGNQPYLYPNVDWLRTLFNKSSDSRRANFSARGGSQTANYYVSLAYYDEKSLLKTDALQKYNSDTRFRRYNFTSNVGMNWTKTTRFDLGVQGYITNTNYPGVNPQDAFGNVMQTNPVLYPTIYPGNIVPGVSSAGAQPNPYGQTTQSGYQNIASNQVYSNAKITQDLSELVSGLSVYGLYSFDVYSTQVINRTRTKSTYLIDKNNPYNADGTLNLSLISTGSDNLDFSNANGSHRQSYVETAINYDHDFGAKSHMTALILYNQKSYTEAFPSDLTASLPYKSQGLAGRATYSWSEKYFGEVNFGYNGSENFAPSNRYGFFPSLGVGWVVSNEKFYEPFKNIFQFLKVRYSNGVVGAAGGGRRFGYLTLVSDQADGYTFGNGVNNTGYGGVSITDYGTDVKWARSHKQDLGIELKTLDSKVSLVVDYFKEHRTGVFLQRGSLADYIGLQNSPWGNIGVINNEGFDGTLEVAPFDVGRTSWTLRGTFSYNKDKVIENDNPVQPFPYMERRGTNYLSSYGYIAEGLFQSQKEIDNAPSQAPIGSPRVGDIRYKDLNGDGKIDANDITRIGSGDVPSLVYGFGLNITWKQWYFGAFFQGVSSATRQLRGDGIIPFSNSTGAERSNLFAVAEDRWTVDNPNPNAFYPRLAYGNAANKNNAVVSTWWQKDISFVRLKTVDCGYNLPKGTLKSIGLKNGRFYLQGINLWYWSKFKLWDPELNTTNGSVYPNTRNVTVGFQANF